MNEFFVHQTETDAVSSGSRCKVCHKILLGSDKILSEHVKWHRMNGEIGLPSYLKESDHVI